MWFPLSLLAMIMVLSRRSVEKNMTRSIDSYALAWLQQTFALPLIIGMLMFARFYLPWDLSANYWSLMAAYVLLGSFDILCYFKALSLADISYLAPLLTLTSVGNIIGAFFILHQTPSVLSMLGAGLIVGGAYIVHTSKLIEAHKVRANRTALLLVLLVVLDRSILANIEVFMLRQSNPIVFNFYSSVLTIPVIFLVASRMRTKKRLGHDHYWNDLRTTINKYRLPLLIIGITYALNMLATYQAKLSAPNAGLVATVKAAQVLPMVLIGVFFFKEKVVKFQWYGLVLILAGLVVLGIS